MNSKVLAGSVLSYAYNRLIGQLPSHNLRMSYLQRYLAQIGQKTSVQMRCRFLNGRKVFFAIAINFTQPNSCYIRPVQLYVRICFLYQIQSLILMPETD